MKATTTPPPTGRVDTSWHEQAKCLYERVEQIRPETDPLFHPAGERAEQRRARDEQAKAICSGCPVMLTCRADARARREAYGVWGGESEDERAAWLAGGYGAQEPVKLEPPKKRKGTLDGTPCKKCGATMRTRRNGRNKLSDLGNGEVFHGARGECNGCYQAGWNREFIARWEITELGADMTLAQLIAEACNGRVQEAAQEQGVRLIRPPHELAFRIDSAAGQLVAKGRARALERGGEVAA